MEIDFNDIANQICTGQTFIGTTRFSDEVEFIEALHSLADYKGKVFYQNIYQQLLVAMRGKVNKFRLHIIDTDVMPFLHSKLLTVAPIASDPEQDKEIINRAELMKRLSISEPTVIAWEKKGKIPVLRIGKSIRYNWPEVKLALSSKKKPI
jgi:hypothetical protein